MAADQDDVDDLVSAQLDELIGPIPEPVETEDSSPPVDDGAEERLAREAANRYLGGV
jgi:hypothetical protein